MNTTEAVYGKLRRISATFNTRTPKETASETISNMYNSLLVDMESMAIVGCRFFRVFCEMEKRYGLDQENIRKEILDKLKNDGFEVSRGSSGWMARVDFLQISWE